MSCQNHIFLQKTHFGGFCYFNSGNIWPVTKENATLGLQDAFHIHKYFYSECDYFNIKWKKMHVQLFKFKLLQINNLQLANLQHTC